MILQVIGSGLDENMDFDITEWINNVESDQIDSNSPFFGQADEPNWSFFNDKSFLQTTTAR